MLTVCQNSDTVSSKNISNVCLLVSELLNRIIGIEEEPYYCIKFSFIHFFRQFEYIFGELVYKKDFANIMVIFIENTIFLGIVFERLILIYAILVSVQVKYTLGIGTSKTGANKCCRWLGMFLLVLKIRNKWNWRNATNHYRNKIAWKPVHIVPAVVTDGYHVLSI